MGAKTKMNRLVGKLCCTVDVSLMIMASMPLDYYYDKLTFY